MKDQIEKLKQELAEFLELSKTITQGEWKQVDDCVDRGGNHRALIAIFGRHAGISQKQDERDATFIARSRNISPALVECLLVAVEGLEKVAFIQENQVTAYAYASNRDLSFNGRNAFDSLQQILTIWEAAK